MTPRTRHADPMPEAGLADAETMLDLARDELATARRAAAAGNQLQQREKMGEIADMGWVALCIAGDAVRVARGQQPAGSTTESRATYEAIGARALDAFYAAYAKLHIFREDDRRELRDPAFLEGGLRDAARAIRALRQALRRGQRGH